MKAFLKAALSFAVREPGLFAFCHTSALLS